MKAGIFRALCALSLLASSTAAVAAVTVEPIDVTIYVDKSFRDKWGWPQGSNTKATAVFNEVKNYYKTNFNLDLRLSRIEAPFFTIDSAKDGDPATAGTILAILRQNLIVPNGMNATAHPSHWLLIHRDAGTNLAGRVDNIGGISKNWRPNLWITTWEKARNDGINGANGICPGWAARSRPDADLRKTAIHEFGHLMAAVHPTAGGCESSVMCTPVGAECIGGFPTGSWDENPTPTTMDQNNKDRVGSHAGCYLTTKGTWNQCLGSNVP